MPRLRRIGKTASLGISQRLKRVLNTVLSLAMVWIGGLVGNAYITKTVSVHDRWLETTRQPPSGMLSRPSTSTRRNTPQTKRIRNWTRA